MSRLIRFYPVGWRARYGAELEQVLEARPPRLADQLDLIFGAFDAHLHPELVVAGPVDTASVPIGHRVPGLAATVGGLLFVGALVGGVISGDDGWLSWIWVALFLMLASLPGGYAARVGGRVGLGLAAIAASFILAWALPWGPNVVPAVAAIVLVGAGSLALATVRAGLDRRRRWVAVGLGFGPPAVALLGVAMGIGGQGEGSLLPLALLVTLYGVAWAAVGLVLTFRGSPTFDPEPRGEPEPAR
jgi:hypothetical protein